MEDYTILNAAEQDVNTNVFPYKTEDGTFVPTPGQRAIMNQPKFQHITALHIQIAQQVEKAKGLRKEILAFDKPSDKLIGSNEKEKAIFTPYMEEERDHRKILQTARREYIGKRMNRGYIPKPPVVAQTVTARQPIEGSGKKSWDWKEIRNGLVSWIAGEVFMTATQFHSLHYYRSVDNIVIRSLAFAVVLFIVHRTSHLYKNFKTLSV